MRRHKVFASLMIGLLAVVTYAGALTVSNRHDRQLASTGSRIVFDACQQSNAIAGVTQAALVQQKRLSRQKFVRGETTVSEWRGQQRALNLAIRGLAPRDCAASAAALRRSVR